MSELEVEADSGEHLWVSQADVQDCFWQCAAPHELARWFGLDSLPGHVLQSWDVDAVEGQAVEAGEHIRPILNCLPMGWSWSMWFVQQLHEQLVLEHFDEKQVRGTTDRRPK